jgi:hypothetical protein
VYRSVSDRTSSGSAGAPLASNTRENNKLIPTQAQTVLAAALLRQLHAVICTSKAWDPHIATHGTRHKKTPTGLAA